MNTVQPVGLSKVERPEPVSTEIVRKLLDYLLSGEIPVGARIPPERQLASALGIGRSAVRDALKPLQLLGLLEVRIGDGTYLNEPDSALLPRVIEWGLLLKATKTFELVETLHVVELALVGFAAERRDAASVERMRHHVDDMATAESKRAFVEGYKAFHYEIAAAGNNSVLSGIFMSIHSLLDVGIQRVVDAEDDTGDLWAEQVLIFKALEAGDRAAAERALSEHMEKGLALLRATLVAE
jgi:GntR family transcriptional regulator, transcriptional repressor for pyruvate dehydrogenase complex